MKVKLVWIGKSNGNYIKEGIADFQKRINRYHTFEVEEIAQVKNGERLKPAELKKKEADLLLKRFTKDDFVVLLDEKGKQYTSKTFAAFLQKQMLNAVKSMVFVVGGAYGFDQKVYERGQMKLALSSMTFSHQLIRVVFLEQLYRANTIIRNEPYHND